MRHKITITDQPPHEMFLQLSEDSGHSVEVKLTDAQVDLLIADLAEKRERQRALREDDAKRRMDGIQGRLDGIRAARRA